jgi:hypothetical protein
MSKIEVNQVDPQSGTTLTLGTSGDTISIPAGVTLANSGTATGFASIAWQSTIVTTSTLTAVAGNGYWIDTTSNACTVTLPGSASVGDQIIFVDYARTWNTNNLTINTNSLNYQGNTSPTPIYNTNGQTVNIVYSGATQGWIPVSDDDVTLETPQNYDIDFLVVAGGASGGTYSVPTSYAVGNNGSNSSISGTGLTTITSAGGGYGGAYNAQAGGDGGSGGGAGQKGSPGTVSGGLGNTPSTTPSQGNNGGTATHPDGGGGGGGGGASAVGGNGDGSTSGDGGDGTASSITGSSVTYAGGGGGCKYLPGSAPNGTGGTGGGGDGGNPGTAGVANTGGGGGAGDNGGAGQGGGGAGGYRTSTQTVDLGVAITITVGDGGAAVGVSGAGGKGVVILSMNDESYSGTTTGSPTVATGVSGKTVLTFTGSGSYTT